MVAITKTNETYYNANLANNNQTHLYVTRKNNAKGVGTDWKKKYEIYWSKYQIKETDMRQKTATFTSPEDLDLTTGVFCILIATPLHENFGGEILSKKYNKDTGLYEYQCQDFSRDYQSKCEIMVNMIKGYVVMAYLITRGGFTIRNNNISNKIKKNYKWVLSGLRPAYHYQQGLYGSTFDFNVMTNKQKWVIRDKSYIQVIRDICAGSYIDVYFDQYGVLQLKPYHKDDFFNTGLHLVASEIADAEYNFDITNIITGVKVQNADSQKFSKYYSSKDVVNLDLSVFFGNNNTMISNPDKTTTKTTTGKTNTNKTNVNTKTAKDKSKNSNPYGTKKKVVYINTDSITGYSSDMKRMKDIAKLLNKHGWTTKLCGVGSESHYRERGNVKNGIWFTIYGGACAGTLKETANNTWFRAPLVKNGSRTVVGFFGACDIRKGGKCYTYLKRAWDDGFSGSGFSGMSYPAKYLTNHAIPFMYAKTPKEMVAKFLKGGDNPEACNKNWKFTTK